MDPTTIKTITITIISYKKNDDLASTLLQPKCYDLKQNPCWMTGMQKL